MNKSRKRYRKLVKILLVVLAGFIAITAGSRLWVHSVANGRIYTDVNRVPKAKVALVLGAYVFPDGELSLPLRDRVNTAIKLYKAGKVEKLLMSGDNRFHHYNEPQRMADYAISKGVPAEDVVADFAGRRTYDSVYRAKHIFGQDRLIVVTQGFHLDRALFLCDKLGVDAYGVPGKWPGAFKSKIREIPASINAIIDVYILRPVPILGDKEEI